MYNLRADDVNRLFDGARCVPTIDHETVETPLSTT